MALCSNGTQLLALRALQGVGAGGAAIIARIIVRDNWSGDELARRLSVLSIAFITALGGGQFVGGLLSQYSHWQMGFVLMGATGLAILALMTTLPLEAGRDRGPRPAMTATYFAILRRPGFLAGLRRRAGFRYHGDAAGGEPVRHATGFWSQRHGVRRAGLGDRHRLL